MKRIFSILACAVAFAAVFPSAARAQDEYGYSDSEDYEEPYEYEAEESSSYGLTYENGATGYQAYVLDKAGLLSETEEELLLEDMIPITDWGNAFFCTSTESRGSSARDLAATLYEETFGYGASGTIFFIDMGRRQLEIHSDGEVYKTITSDYAQTITDNIYRMASGGDYYACASEAFRQMKTLLAGGKIRQPMKHASNALLALALSLFICYLYMAGSSKTASEKAQPKAGPVFKGDISNLDVIPGKLTSRTIQSSSSGRSGFSGGGGGGHSGGGGGHSF